MYKSMVMKKIMSQIRCHLQRLANNNNRSVLQRTPASRESQMISNLRQILAQRDRGDTGRLHLLSI